MKEKKENHEQIGFVDGANDEKTEYLVTNFSVFARRRREDGLKDILQDYLK